MAAVIICNDFGAQENKICHCFHSSLFYSPWSDETGAMILVFWMLSCKPAFSLSSFTFIRRLFSSLGYHRMATTILDFCEKLIWYVNLNLFYPPWERIHRYHKIFRDDGSKQRLKQSHTIRSGVPTTFALILKLSSSVEYPLTKQTSVWASLSLQQQGQTSTFPHLSVSTTVLPISYFL